MSDLPQSASIYLPGGRTGVLVIHGFTGSPASVAPWAQGFHDAGFTVLAPALAGHATTWQDLNHTTWRDWYSTVESNFLALKKECDRVFVAGFSVGGALTLKLAQIRSSEIEGALLVNAPVFDERKILRLVPLLKSFVSSVKSGRMDVNKPHSQRFSYDRLPLKAVESYRQLLLQVEADLYLVDLPLMVAYSLDDHVVEPRNSETIIDNVLSSNIREVIFEKSFHNVPLDYDSEALNIESVQFVHDVLAGELSRNSISSEADLIDAEFEAMVSGLSLDQSSPTTYLDELDRPRDGDFVPPNPTLKEATGPKRYALTALIAGPIYLLVNAVTSFNLFGTGVWPGVLAIVGGVLTLIWHSARNEDADGPGGTDGFDDGAVF